MKTIALSALSFLAFTAIVGCGDSPKSTTGTGTSGSGASTSASSGTGAMGGDGGFGGQGGQGGSGAAGGGVNCMSGSANMEGCNCTDGESARSCYGGPEAQAGKGQCTMGTQSCITTGEGEFIQSAWGACVGYGQPGPETCNDAVDNDCDGIVNNNCGCMDGQTQPCDTGNGPGTQTCEKGDWGLCTCVEGTSQMCNGANGQPGMQICEKGQWTECNGSSIPIVGQPCTPGDLSNDDTNQCPPFGNSMTNVLECDTNGIWNCFPADDCTYAACKACLETNCAAQMVNPDPQCQSQLTTAVNWLEHCGPDRSNYFTSLSNGCASPNGQDLNSCKFQHCIQNGTCSFW